ncbi:MAG: diguanylate cyclase [Gammaproteobacteria bacterium]|nr:diguanylate cyclase [Gammaproteobacteria bacterium]
MTLDITSNPLRILLVDDDEDDYVLTRSVFKKIENRDYQVMWAGSYHQALRATEEHAFDVLLLDFHLGEKTGLHLLDELRVRHVQTPAILLTGVNDRHVDGMALEKGVADYLVKSQLEPSLLERSIRYTLERQKSANQILEMAYHDRLTGLCNRYLLADRMDRAITNAKGTGKKFAVMFIDLDNFKQINDTNGHTVGDHILVNVAEQLSGCVRESDNISTSRNNENTIGRQGGDEFIIILGNLVSGDEARLAAERILNALNKPIMVGELSITVGASIGIAVFPDDGETAETLLRNADKAMYETKSSGKNSYQYFDKARTDRILASIQLQSDLVKVMNEEPLGFSFHTLVNFNKSKAYDYIAECHWRSASGEMLTQSRLFDLVKQSGLDQKFLLWQLQSISKAWSAFDCHDRNGRISLQVSTTQLLHPETCVLMKKMQRDTNFPMPQLEFRVNENQLASLAVNWNEPTEAAAITACRSLHDLGIHLALDEVGAGLSSFRLLALLPINRLYFSENFAQDLLARQERPQMIQGVLNYCDALDLEMVITGVARNGDIPLLTQMGCHILGGEAVEQFLNREKVLSGTG